MSDFHCALGRPLGRQAMVAIQIVVGVAVVLGVTIAKLPDWCAVPATVLLISLLAVSWVISWGMEKLNAMFVTTITKTMASSSAAQHAETSRHDDSDDPHAEHTEVPASIYITEIIKKGKKYKGWKP